MFKDRLKQLRTERNLKQSDVAKALGVSTATIGNYEQGTREPRNYETWKKLASFFDVTVDDLMGKVTDSNLVRSVSLVSYDRKKWFQQFRTDVSIIYNDEDITSLVFSRDDDHTPITLEQQLAFASFHGRSGHVLYARKQILELLNDLKAKSKIEITKNLDGLIDLIQSDIVFWYKRCWDNIDDLFPKATDLETLYDLVNACLCADMIAEKEFYLLPFEDDLDWLREKLR